MQFERFLDAELRDPDGHAIAVRDLARDLVRGNEAHAAVLVFVRHFG